MIRLLVDENVPSASVVRLQEAGLDVVRVASGATDRSILERDRAEQRVLVTFHRDFGFLVFRGGAPPPPGVVYFRTEPMSPGAPADELLELLNTPGVAFEGKLTVIETGRVRQRPLPSR